MTLVWLNEAMHVSDIKQRSILLHAIKFNVKSRVSIGLCTSFLAENVLADIRTRN